MVEGNVKNPLFFQQISEGHESVDMSSYDDLAMDEEETDGGVRMVNEDMYVNPKSVRQKKQAMAEDRRPTWDNMVDSRPVGKDFEGQDLEFDTTLIGSTAVERTFLQHFPTPLPVA